MESFKSKIADELKRVSIGSFCFLHSSDDYPKTEKKKEDDNIGYGYFISSNKSSKTTSF